jgi:hypothetical protein
VLKQLKNALYNKSYRAFFNLTKKQMNQFLFKPENHKMWSEDTLDTIVNAIESCNIVSELEEVKEMADNFIMMLAINTDFKDDTIQDISKQLYLSISLKKKHLNNKNE